MALLSKRSIRFLNNCKENAEQVHFDVINGQIFLTTLIGEETAHLCEYILKEGDYSVDELGELLGKYISKKISEITIPESTLASVWKRKLGISELPKYQSENGSIVVFVQEDGTKHTYAFSQDVCEILKSLIKLSKEKKLKKIEPIHILAAMFVTESKILKKLFADLGLKFSQAKEHFCSNKMFNLDKVPYELLNFLLYMNDEVDITKPCDILQRDKEIGQIWNILLKKDKHNTLLVGEPGVGKTALMQKITYQIQKGNCPNRFKKSMVLKLDLNAIMADEDEALENVFKFLKRRKNIILLIDDVNSIISSGKMPKATLDFLDILNMIVKSDVMIVCAISEEEYETLYACDESLFRMFERVILAEPLSCEVYPMIKSKIDALIEYHGVHITKEIAEYAIMISNCFDFYKVNPDKTLDVLDRSMVIAKRKGKGMVDTSDVQESFEINFELYEGMDEDDRKETAYHEAGHYIVGKASKSLKMLSWQAISIMPAGDYQGITCPEVRRDKTAFTNKQFFIDYLAYCLGGRVAEKIFRKEVSSGAEHDLHVATSMAYNIVTKYGISAGDEDERNNVFLQLMLTEKVTNKIDDEVIAFVEKAYKRAEEVIEEHGELLEMIVSELLKKKIMSEPELDEVWQKYLKEKGKSIS